MKINTPETVLALCKHFGIPPVIDYVDPAVGEKVLGVNSIGAEELQGVNDLLKGIADHVRAQVLLPPSGQPVYVVTKDSKKAALDEGNKNGWRQQERNANFVQYGATGLAEAGYASEGRRFYVAQTFKDDGHGNWELEGLPIENTIVFHENSPVGRDGAAAAIRDLLKGLPDQSFWGAHDRMALAAIHS